MALKMKKYTNINDAMIELHERLNGWITVNRGALREPLTLTTQELKDLYQQDIAIITKIPRKHVTDSFMLDYINGLCKEGFDVALAMYRTLITEQLLSEHKKVTKEIRSIRQNINKNRALNQHDYNTDFKKEVCYYTLHAMLKTAYVDCVARIRNVSEISFLEWLQSAESNAFIANCYIAVSNAEIYISEKDTTTKLSYTTKDLSDWSKKVEKQALREEIEYEEDRRHYIEELRQKSRLDDFDIDLALYEKDLKIKELEEEMKVLRTMK